MPSKIVARGCAPTADHPLVYTVAQASNVELAEIYAFWQRQPDDPAGGRKALAIGIVEREIGERTCLDAAQMLTLAQQRRVMIFGHQAPGAIGAFESFRVVFSHETGTAWIIYVEQQLGRPRAHALMVDSDGSISEGLDDPRLAERLGERLPDVDIFVLFAPDGSDTPLMPYFKPAIRLPV